MTDRPTNLADYLKWLREDPLGRWVGGTISIQDERLQRLEPLVEEVRRSLAHVMEKPNGKHKACWTALREQMERIDRSHPPASEPVPHPVLTEEAELMTTPGGKETCAFVHRVTKNNPKRRVCGLPDSADIHGVSHRPGAGRRLGMMNGHAFVSGPPPKKEG